jgi:signal transduction histidine kinase
MLYDLLVLNMLEKAFEEKTILYIDDEEKNLSSFKAVFRKEYKVYVASSAQEGIEIMETHPINLVITDQRMPNMTGVEFLERIVDRYPDVTRIILTGYSDVEAIIQAINKGQVYRYITKPWRREELKETIDNALEYHFLKQENHGLIESLRKANTELDRFVYSAAHDLRAPIASLMGLINLAKDESDVAQLKYYLSLKENTVWKLNAFIQEIIDYSRNQRADIEPDEVFFKDLVEDALSLFAQEDATNYKRVNFHLDIVQNVPFHTDRARLEVIIKNLLSNVLRFYKEDSTEQPFCDIILRIENDIATFQVRDNGIGIGAEHLEKIFEMFYRATDQRVGSGLGLFLVRETAHKLNGAVRVASIVGEGTMFSVELPDLKINPILPQN